VTKLEYEEAKKYKSIFRWPFLIIVSAMFFTDIGFWLYFEIVLLVLCAYIAATMYIDNQIKITNYELVDKFYRDIGVFCSLYEASAIHTILEKFKKGYITSDNIDTELEYAKLNITNAQAEIQRLKEFR
jgi:hypothetical protein